eukprot:5796194-Prymnesium_polylepis.1
MAKRIDGAALAQCQRVLMSRRYAAHAHRRKPRHHRRHRHHRRVAVAQPGAACILLVTARQQPPLRVHERRM